jgi:glycosyltransferase involved in cell wall biosynthesis
MKLLVVSHACITPVNQSLYADVAAATGWDVTLLVPSGWNTEYATGAAVVRWPDFHGELLSVPVWRSGDIPLHLYRTTFVPLLRRLRPDAIYMHHEPYGLATMQMWLANRLCDDVPFGFYAAQNIAKRYPPPFRWFEQIVLKHAQFSFPVSVEAQQLLRAKGYAGAADVLPLAVDGRLYRPQPEWAAQKRAELGIAADDFVVGYLGRLVEEKGLAAMVRSLTALHGQAWRCVLVGSGPYEAALRQQIAELGLADRVLFIGYVPHTEAPGWLSLFNVLVLPSESRPRWKEQFGRVLVEAMACGTPVVGSDSGEIPNVIRQTGGGLIFPEGDAHALGACLLSLAIDPAYANRLAQAGAAVVEAQYGQPYLAGRFAATIQAAVQRAGRER